MSCRVLGLVCVLCAAWASITPACAGLQFVTQGRSSRLVIFIDGLKPQSAISFGAAANDRSWPRLMAGDTDAQANQLPVERYDSAVLTMSGPASGQASIPQAAIRALAEIKAAKLTESYDAIFFVAHGSGGLVLKSMLVQAATSGLPGLEAKTKAVFLLSVPARGRAAADFMAALAAHESLAIDFGDLDIGVFLQGLESLWSEYLSRRGPTRHLEVYCRRETAPTFGIAVASGQYAAEGCDDNTDDPGTDHKSLARPASRQAGAYRWFAGHLANYFERFPSDPAPRAAAAKATLAGGPPADGTATAMAANADTKPVTDFTPTPITIDPADAASALATPPDPTAPHVAGQTVDPATAQAPPEADAGHHRRWRASAKMRAGDWTFALKHQDCSLTSQLWVVQIHGHRLSSENWDTKIARDGKFVIDHSDSCVTELVRGTISGRSGSGWYLYSNPCQAIYCRTRFHLTWRRPLESAH